jgi:hypothetical protein
MVITYEVSTRGLVLYMMMDDGLFYISLNFVCVNRNTPLLRGVILVSLLG